MPVNPDYNKVLATRKRQYKEHISKMAFIDPALHAWAERMSAKHGSMVKVWHNQLDWLSALMVVRYGEAIEHWPQGTSVADHGCSQEWESGNIPYSVEVASTLTLGKE